MNQRVVVGWGTRAGIRGDGDRVEGRPRDRKGGEAEKRRRRGVCRPRGYGAGVLVYRREGRRKKPRLKWRGYGEQERARARIHEGRLHDQHRVTVAEKTVFVGDGFGVDLLQPGNAVGRAGREKRRDEAEQRRTRLVEVCDQRIDAGKCARRVDENIGFGEMRLRE